MKRLLRLFPTDHKTVGLASMAQGVLFLLVGGSLALLIRWQLAYPGAPIPLVGKLLFPLGNGSIPPHAYTVLFTLHGTVMIFFAVTPLLIGGLGVYLLPLLLGSRNMAYPRLSTASLWLSILGSLSLLSSFFVPFGPAASAWTAYPPLSTTAPGAGQTLWSVALFLSALSSILGAVNTLATVLRKRAPGMDVFRMPLTVWGFTFTAILNVLFLPVLSAAMLLLFMDRTFGTTIFAAAVPGSTAHGDPVLYQHLFWIFGHPEVYLVILPAWGVLGDLLAVFSRKPAFGYRMTVLSMALITLLSGFVYGHHMFTVGLGPLFSEAFMLLTLMISIPSSILYLNWLGTLWRGSIRLDPPMLFCLGMMVVFALGGLTGMHLGAAGTNLYLHDSYFVVGHFHLTMAVSVLLGTFAGIYYWFPKMTGRMLGKGLSHAHFWLTFVPSILVFGGMLLLGYAGMQRRLYNPSEFDFLKPLAGLNRGVSWMAFVLGFGQLLFLWNVVVSWKRGLPAPANPWGAGTLEWLTSSPPTRENFAEIPVVRCAPHVFRGADSSGRDFRSQIEEA